MIQKQIGIFCLSIVVVANVLLPIFYRNIGQDIAFFFANGIGRTILFALYLIFAIKLRRWHQPSIRDWAILLVRGSVGACAFLADFFAIQHLSLGTNYFIYNAGVIITSFILGNFLFKEKNNKSKFISLALALLGLFLVYKEQFHTFSEGVWLACAFIAGICLACWSTLEKIIDSRISTAQITAIDFGLVSLIYFACSFFAQEVMQYPSLTTSWLSIAGICILIGIAGYAMVAGFRRLEAETGSLILLIQIPLVALVGFVLFKENIGLEAFFGGLCILSASVLPFARGVKFHKKI